MFGIYDKYTISLSFLGYSPDRKNLRFRVRTEPNISGIVRIILQDKLHKSCPFITLTGDILTLSLKDTGATKYLEDIQIKDDTITIKVNWR